MPRSSRLETHDHSTCGFMAWCRKSGAQVAGKLENSTAIVAADGEKSARIDLKVLPAFDKCPNEGKDELRSLLQHSFDGVLASARAADCAGKRAFGNRVAAWPKLAPDRRFGYIWPTGT